MAETTLSQAFLAICQTKARYCRALDDKDWDTYASVFTDDYELDISEDTGLAPIKGRDNAVSFVRESIGNARTAHQVHLPLIDLEGDRAKVVWALQDRLIWDPPKHGMASMTGYGEYHQDWVLVGGEWKIARLRLTRFHIDRELVGSD